MLRRWIKLKKQDIKDSMFDNFMPYTTHLILHRALPMIDGLKPSQRRVLYTMYDKKILRNKDHVKCRSIAGDVSKIHPHGSSYDTLVRMTEGHEAFGVPLIDSKGSFGKIYSRDEPPAAERYTEARLNKIAEQLFIGINKNAVEMKDTYDGQSKEPLLLPTSFPLVLMTGADGMAAGMATKFPMFNFNEVIDYTAAVLNKENPDVLDYIPSPDFPTDNTIVYDKEEMRALMEKGRGKFRIRAQYEIDGESIHFKNVPFTVKYENILDQIEKLAKGGKLKEVIDVHDNYGMDDTGVSSTGLIVEAKKGTEMNSLVSKLFLMTSLEDSFSANMNIVLNYKPQVLGVVSIIEEWIKFRKETITKSLQFEIDENNLQIEKLKGLDKIKDVLDEVVHLIRNTVSSEISSKLQNEFSLTEKQASYIENIQLRNLAKDYILKRTHEIKSLEESNESLYKNIINDDSLSTLIVDQLKKLNNEYIFPRRTALIDKKEATEQKNKITNTVNEPEDYNLKLFISKDLYLKKLPLTSMRGKYTNRLKEDDTFTIEEEMTNLGEVIVFTNHHNIYKKRLSEIEDTKPSELGEYLPSMFNYEKGEKPLFAIPMRKEFDQVVVLGFNDGTLAKVDSQAYYTKQNRTVLKNGYADKELIFVSLNSSLKYLKAITEEYQIVRDMSQFNSKASRTTSGSRFINLNENDRVVSYKVATEEDVEKYLMKSAGRGKKK